MGGTDPFGRVPMDRRADLAQSLLGELARRGLGQQEIARRAGVQPVDPHQMSPQVLAALARWMQQQHPQAFGRVTAQHQREPDVLVQPAWKRSLRTLLDGLGREAGGQSSRVAVQKVTPGNDTGSV